MMDCVTQSAASQVSKNDFLSHQLKHSLPSDGSPDATPTLYRIVCLLTTWLGLLSLLTPFIEITIPLNRSLWTSPNIALCSLMFETSPNLSPKRGRDSELHSCGLNCTLLLGNQMNGTYFNSPHLCSGPMCCHFPDLSHVTSFFFSLFFWQEIRW